MSKRHGCFDYSIIQDGPEPDRTGPRRLEVVKTDLCRPPSDTWHPVLAKYTTNHCAVG